MFACSCLRSRLAAGVQSGSGSRTECVFLALFQGYEGAKLVTRRLVCFVAQPRQWKREEGERWLRRAQGAGAPQQRKHAATCMGLRMISPGSRFFLLPTVGGDLKYLGPTYLCVQSASSASLPPRSLCWIGAGLGHGSWCVVSVVCECVC